VAKPTTQISSATVRADFNDPVAVVHYARAAHHLGLWKSEKLLIERFFPERTAHLLEAGCGAGRVTLGLWELGYHHLTAFDFAEELVDQARALAQERSAQIPIHHADATKPLRNLSGYTPPLCPSGNKNVSDTKRNPFGYALFDGALFMFNGLMQIPGRANRRLALQNLAEVCRPGAPLLFTTHDRDHSRVERAAWRIEAHRWTEGTQDPRLVEFGDRYFEDDVGRTFMHLPDREEILEDLGATGWTHEFDSMRRDLVRESRAVVDFSDECRFWMARRSPRT
jgi:SAM-dependent methyltransferase